MAQTDEPTAPARYGVAVAAVVAAVFTRLGLDPWLGDDLPYITFFPPLALAAWFGGLGPGLVVTALGALAADLLYVAPRGALMPGSQGGTLGLGIFTFNGLILSLIAEQNRRAQAKAEANARDAARRQEWLRVTVMSIGDAVIATDEAGRVRLMNEVASQLTGWRPDEAAGRPLAEVFPISNEATGAPAENPVDRALREGRVVGLVNHTVLTARDGTRRPIDDSAAPIRDTDGFILGAVLVFRDVTGPRASAAALARSESDLRDALALAEESGRAKDRFLAMLSHELRTPLTPVLLVTDEHLADPATPPAARDALRLIRQNVALEARLIDDLLDVTRIIHGKLVYRFEEVDPAPLVERALEACRAEARGKGVSLAYEPAPRLPRVRADPGRLQQVVGNLVRNALKFTPPGGSVRVATRGDGAGLAVEVSDTGIGIEPEALPRIFRAFEQANDTTGRRFGGLGLGLAISKSIAEAHGGTLGGVSEGTGLGATFTLTVPAADPGHTPEPPSADGDSAGAPAGSVEGLRVLLVEDDPLTARVMARLLRRDGYAVTTAGTLADALAVDTAAFDVLVSDLALPDGTGLDLMRQLAARADVPGIALTGFGRDEDVRRCEEAGFAAHLTKPIEYARLDAALRHLAAGRRPRP